MGMRDAIKKETAAGGMGARLSERKMDGVHIGVLGAVKEISPHSGDATILDFICQNSNNEVVRGMCQSALDAGIDMAPFGLYYKDSESSRRKIMRIICNIAGQDDEYIRANPAFVDAFLDGAFNGIPITVTSQTKPQVKDPSKDFTNYEVTPTEAIDAFGIVQRYCESKAAPQAQPQAAPAPAAAPAAPAAPAMPSAPVAPQPPAAQ
jgi:hypothetical protein